MPPTGRLADEQITDVVRWIHEGAKDPRSAVVEARPSSGDWWSLKPLVRPEIPASIKGARNQEIDLFIRQKLDRHSIEPSPEADRRTLLTRLSFDLIGLPPSIEELEAFERDDSPDAVSKKLMNYSLLPITVNDGPVTGSIRFTLPRRMAMNTISHEIMHGDIATM